MEGVWNVMAKVEEGKDSLSSVWKSGACGKG